MPNANRRNRRNKNYNKNKSHHQHQCDCESDDGGGDISSANSNLFQVVRSTIVTIVSTSPINSDSSCTDNSSNEEECFAASTGEIHNKACECFNCRFIKTLVDPNNNSDKESRNLILKTAKAKYLLEKCKTYSKILKSQKLINQKQEHLLILDRANALNSMYLKNMESIRMLGHCRVLLKERTSGVTKGLIEVHRIMHEWDEVLEENFNRTKTTKTVVSSLTEYFRAKLGKELDSLSDERFSKFFEELEEDLEDDLPEVIRDNEKLEDLCNQIDILNKDKEWTSFREMIEAKIYRLEIEFTDICIQYGIRRNLPIKELESADN